MAGQTYIRGLDGIRAIAIGIVFFGHTFRTLIDSSIGVDLFFVLSGFLITRGLRGQLITTGRINLRAFYARRFLRLAPALFLMLATFLIVASLMHEWRRPHVIAAVLAAGYMMNWNRAFGWFSEAWFGHAWSLSIEEQFYLLWPLILALGYRWRGRAVVSLALFLAIASLVWRLYLLHHGATFDRVYNGFDTHADGLLFGCALALIDPPRAWRWCRGRSWLVPAVLEFAPLRYIGRISYGLYLWHWPALMVLWQLGYEPDTIRTAFLAGTVAFTGAVLSYHLVERPILENRYRSRQASRHALDRQGAAVPQIADRVVARH